MHSSEAYTTRISRAEFDRLTKAQDDTEENGGGAPAAWVAPSKKQIVGSAPTVSLQPRCVKTEPTAPLARMIRPRPSLIHGAAADRMANIKPPRDITGNVATVQLPVMDMSGLSPSRTTEDHDDERDEATQQISRDEVTAFLNQFEAGEAEEAPTRAVTPNNQTMERLRAVEITTLRGDQPMITAQVLEQGAVASLEHHALASLEEDVELLADVFAPHDPPQTETPSVVAEAPRAVDPLAGASAWLLGSEDDLMALTIAEYEENRRPSTHDTSFKDRLVWTTSVLMMLGIIALLLALSAR